MGCVQSRYRQRRLRHADHLFTPAYQPSVRWGKVVEVKNGDTVQLAFLDRGHIARHPLRLRRGGPALRPRTPDEKHMAQCGGEELGRLLQGRLIELLEPVRWDRCGRLLADARLPGVVPSVCEWLAEHATGRGGQAAPQQQDGSYCNKMYLEQKPHAQKSSSP